MLMILIFLIYGVDGHVVDAHVHFDCHYHGDYDYDYDDDDDNDDIDDDDVDDDANEDDDDADNHLVEPRMTLPSQGGRRRPTLLRYNSSQF